MTTNKNLFPLLIILYCLLYFSLSTIIYFYSISSGYGGLGIPLFGGGDDGEFYYAQALNVAEGRPAVLTSIHALVLGYILKLFNTDQVYVLRAFNFIGNILTLLVGLKILSLLKFGEKNLNAGIIFILLLGYYPSILLNSNLSIIRDSWIVFYYLLSILFSFNILRSSKFSIKVLCSIFLFLALWMLMGYRNYALLGFLVSNLIYFLFIHQKNNRYHFKSIILYMIIAFSVVYTFLRAFKFPIVGRSLLDILSYRMTGIEVYGGGSQMNISLDQSNVILFYLNYIYSILSNALGPFPWQFTGISSVILFFSESILFVFIIYKLYKLKNLFSKYDYFIIINCIVWFMLIGIFNDNIGTAARLRMVGWIPLFIVFAKVFGEQLIFRGKLKMKKVIG